jgi:hypothetical protein
VRTVHTENQGIIATTSRDVMLLSCLTVRDEVFKERSIRGHSVQGRLGPGRGVLTPRESECKGRWWRERWQGGGGGGNIGNINVSLNSPRLMQPNDIESRLYGPPSPSPSRIGFGIVCLCDGVCACV